MHGNFSFRIKSETIYSYSFLVKMRVSYLFFPRLPPTHFFFFWPNLTQFRHSLLWFFFSSFCVLKSFMASLRNHLHFFIFFSSIFILIIWTEFYVQNISMLIEYLLILWLSHCSFLYLKDFLFSYNSFLSNISSTWGLAYYRHTATLCWAELFLLLSSSASSLNPAEPQFLYLWNGEKFYPEARRTEGWVINNEQVLSTVPGS